MARIPVSRFEDRAQIKLRLLPDLHDKLSALAAEAGMTQNLYVLTVVELGVLQPISWEEATAWSDEIKSWPELDRRSATIRLAPTLKRKVAARADEAGLSTNAYMCWLIARVVYDGEVHGRGMRIEGLDPAKFLATDE